MLGKHFDFMNGFKYGALFFSPALSLSTLSEHTVAYGSFRPTALLLSEHTLVV